MKILSIDLGTNYGWCYKDQAGEELGHDTYEDLIDWGNKFKKLLEKWKPSLIVLSQTNSYGHFNASRKMLMQAGVAFYLCGKKKIQGIEINDSHARKVVLGKAMKKKEVQQLYPDMQADELDAYILAECAYLEFNN